MEDGKKTVLFYSVQYREGEEKLTIRRKMLQAVILLTVRYFRYFIIRKFYTCFLFLESLAVVFYYFFLLLIFILWKAKSKNQLPFNYYLYKFMKYIFSPSEKFIINCTQFPNLLTFQREIKELRYNQKSEETCILFRLIVE